MQRISASFYIDNINVFKEQMLNWTNRFSICSFMDSHNYADKYHRYDCLIAADARKIFSPSKNIIAQLDNFYKENSDWIFGHIGYDLKNEIEDLQSMHSNKIGFADIFFFVPKIVLSLKDNLLTIHSIEKKTTNNI